MLCFTLLQRETHKNHTMRRQAELLLAACFILGGMSVGQYIHKSSRELSRMTQSSAGPREIQQTDQLSQEEKQQRKQQVLTQGRSSITRSIADAVTIKDTNVFFLTCPDGNIPVAESHGYGLYYHDCRFLNGYELRVADTKLNPLVSTGASGSTAIFELTNPELMIREGEHIPSEQIGVTWRRSLDGQELELMESIRLHNYGSKTVRFPLSLSFQAGFEDVFNIRGLLSEQPGEVQPPSWKDGRLVFLYEGADERFRGLSIQFQTSPDQRKHGAVEYDITVEPRASVEITLRLVLAESEDRDKLDAALARPIQRRSSEVANQRQQAAPFGIPTSYVSDSLLLNNTIQNSLHDLQMLITTIDGSAFFAAGIPWFTTLFGRDSLITSFQMLAFQPETAAETLRLLARLQAQQKDDWRDAQPGKILHELRIGELARLGEIPHSPYYGTVDATPLFLILLAQHAQWTGSIDLFHELHDAVEAALTWIDRYGDTNNDGYIDYASKSSHGLINQGWKDSGDALVNADGTLATPPISLVEVQGYVYAAKNGIADLFEQSGESDRAARLREEADALRLKFNRDFWLEEEGIYAFALEAKGKPLQVISSNPGHALWSGIAEPEKAQRTAARLMEDDMFNGWGIRTLSSREKAYNPTGYHLGTVWPHDNALIAVGFRRYGFDESAQRILKGILEAAMNFRHYRLPELFSGFSRAEYRIPVHYPVACHPQAWAAASIPYLISSFLGLEPAAFEKKLRIRRPTLPDFVDRMDVDGLRVGNATVDLHYERSASGETVADVRKVKGDLNVQT